LKPPGGRAAFLFCQDGEWLRCQQRSPWQERRLPRDGAAANKPPLRAPSTFGGDLGLERPHASFNNLLVKATSSKVRAFVSAGSMRLASVDPSQNNSFRFYARCGRFCMARAPIALSTTRMSAYVQYLTEEHTVYGLTFQYWMPLVVGFFLLWIGLWELLDHS
jgi:hypothetical protein